MTDMNSYQRPMQPWPELAPYACTFQLPHSRLTLYLYDAGDKNAPPVLLVHGLADEADTWRHILPALAAQYRVIAPDLPGFGRSDKPNLAYTPAFFQDVLLELMDALAIQRATLTGQSLGAVISQSIALNHPERVQHLILIDGSLVTVPQKLDRATLMFLVPGLGEWLYTRLRKDPQAAYQTLQPYYSHLDRLPQADRDFLFQRVNERVWSDGQRRAFFSTFRSLVRWLPAQQRGLASRLAGLDISTLAVWGEGDLINPVESGRALVKVQPSARLIVVPDAGHDVHQEKPEAVLNAIESVAAPHVG